MFQSAVTLAAFNALQSVLGVSATIARGNQSCMAVVVISATDQMAITNTDFVFSAGTRGILIAVTDYKPTGSPSLPQDGDQITLTENLNTLVLAVRPPDDNSRSWRHWPGGAVFETHTRLLSGG